MLAFAGMLFIANKWASGKLNKPLKALKNFKKKYGVTTIILIVLWWILTPSGLPDDFLTIWFILTVGFNAYLVTISLLTLYLIYRMKIVLVIGGKRR